MFGAGARCKPGALFGLGFGRLTLPFRFPGRENPGWGYRRINGELLVLDLKVAASTVREILKEAGTDWAPELASTTWADLLALFDTILADAGIETVLSGVRIPRMNSIVEQGAPPGPRLEAGADLPPRTPRPHRHPGPPPPLPCQGPAPTGRTLFHAVVRPRIWLRPIRPEARAAMCSVRAAPGRTHRPDRGGA
ncbi:hypothetical protein ACFO3J_18145 [Streptomyces polygonati]|uniref:Mutator family transposase n=1 Tax=Streptomyces polygonati TaxID=1617087 RepID=A0ABV8HN10_9ACTN